MSDCRAPVFVVGCPRSGTTLLYHMLLSAGGFVVYRAETHLYDLLVPRYADFSTRRGRRRFAEEWIESEYFRRTGLRAGTFRDRLLRECNEGGDVLRLLMEEMMEAQGAERWAECTPAHALHLERIKLDFPDALFLHVVRDGRDVALSLQRLGWIRPFPWDRRDGLMAAGLYWRWFVGQARRQAIRVGEDLLQVRFEELVEDPEDSLRRVGRFIGTELDYDRIREVAIGSVSRPNTSFEDGEPQVSPLRRWARRLDDREISHLEGLTGDLLSSLGYERAASERDGPPSWRLRPIRALYDAYFTLRHRLKHNRLLGPLFTAPDLTSSGFDDTVEASSGA